MVPTLQQARLDLGCAPTRFPIFLPPQVLHPTRAKELRDALAQPQSRAGLAEALTALKARLDASGVAYEDLSGAFRFASRVRRRDSSHVNASANASVGVALASV